MNKLSQIQAEIREEFRTDFPPTSPEEVILFDNIEHSLDYLVSRIAEATKEAIVPAPKKVSTDADIQDAPFSAQIVEREIGYNECRFETIKNYQSFISEK